MVADEANVIQVAHLPRPDKRDVKRGLGIRRTVERAKVRTASDPDNSVFDDGVCPSGGKIARQLDGLPGNA
jgi:hypothetical protein